MAGVSSRWHRRLALPSSSLLWPPSHQHRGHPHRAAKPSSSRSTDPGQLTAQRNTTVLAAAASVLN